MYVAMALHTGSCILLINLDRVKPRIIAAIRPVTKFNVPAPPISTHIPRKCGTSQTVMSAVEFDVCFNFNKTGRCCARRVAEPLARVNKKLKSKQENICVSIICP